MGRLLRKKKTIKKKGQNGEIVSTDLVREEGNTQQEAVISVSTQEIQKKRPISPPLRKLAAAPAKDNFITQGIQFLREVRAELKKVTWPTRKQAIGSTLVVVVLVMIISAFLGVIDMGLSSLIRLVLQ